MNDSDFVDNEWIPASFVKNRLVVEREDSVMNDTPGEILWNLYKRPYWTIVNILQALFVPGKMDGWPAIAFNLVLFIAIQMMLYKMINKYSRSCETAMLAVILYGFSGMIVSLNSYIRFYIFSCFLCVLFTFLHMLIWEQDIRKWYKILIYEVVALLCAKWSIEASQFSLFLVLIFIGMFYIALVAHKRWGMMCIYAAPCVAGGYYLFAKTNYIYMLSHLRDAYENATGPTYWVLSSVMTLSPITFLERAVHEGAYIGKFAYGYLPVFVLFIVLSIFCFLRWKKDSFFLHPMERVMFGTLIGYFLVATALHFYTEVRYSTHGWFLIAWFTAKMMLFFKNHINNKVIANIVITIMVVSVILPSVSGKRVVYVMRIGEELEERLSKQNIEYTVVSYYGDCGESNDTIYQAVSLLNDDSYFMAAGDINAVADKLPDELMLATRDYSNHIDDCLALGYEVKWKEVAGLYEYYYLVSE
ncbi:hypothetical protein [Butyrivibrio sp. VCB2006]|uniref:hypothetical protein n=1 Tax=Butyrivibrio sp. VCB2006 TaxID=1280679 RepID=UPI0012DC0434|nr:hypothetical protein [Butyrivibrio sp. VCB2006]